MGPDILLGKDLQHAHLDRAQAGSAAEDLAHRTGQIEKISHRPSSQVETITGVARMPQEV
jgi:hypothetical protein